MAKRKKNRRIKKTKYLSLTSLRFPRHSIDPLPPTTDDDNMDYLLSSASHDGDATILLLFDASCSSPADLPVVVPNCNSDDLSTSPGSVSYVSESMNLVRTALRSREMDSTPHHHVERYVQYSEVVDGRRDHEEVTSPTVGAVTVDERRRRLALKLDYEEIMKAWSDKGGFYVSPSRSEFPPQTVPDVIHDQHSFTYGGVRVPEGALSSMLLNMKEEVMEEERKCPETPGQREASVLRYKEKRRNRLFSKTIRYQVRKENAQKRPRVKGRFVKRS